MTGIWRLFLCFVCLPAGAAFSQSFTEVPESDHLNLEHAWGLAVGDYDNDGDDDLFIPAQPSRLLINEGNGTFRADGQFNDIHARAAVWADINDDGWLDLVVTSWESSGIYINERDGNFRLSGKLPVTKRQTLLAGDLNGDQWIDIYTSNFRQPNELFLNDGKGRLINMATGSGAQSNQSGMGGLLIDFEQDGDLDIYLVFDGDEPNHLLLNDGEGNFTESAGVYGLDTRTQGMGTDYADFNRDGRYDYYISNLFHNYFMISQPDGTYRNVAPELGMDDNGMAWGLVVTDFDNDGDADIYVNNKYGFSAYPNQLYRNDGNMTFTDVAEGTDLENNMAGFGCGISDIDNDGRQDLIVINEDDTRSVRIFRNTHAGGHWVQLTLAGRHVNKFGVGSVVTVHAGNEQWRRELTLGSGYSTQNSYRLHFGLGEMNAIDSVIIRWPDGSRDRYESIAADQRYLAIQGESLSPFTVSNYKKVLSASSALGPASGIPEIEFPEGDYSIARMWNEALLYAIRQDLARPTVHARNLFHSSMLMYDIWATYAGTGEATVFLGENFQGYTCPFAGVSAPENPDEAIREAISYGMYYLLRHRFRFSPGGIAIQRYLETLMTQLGYDVNFSSTDYSSGNPAALGRYLADQIITFGMQDGSNEEQDYANLYYSPVNEPLDPEQSGNPTISDPDRWQPLSIDNFVDQSGIPIGVAPPFLGPEWGRVKPFALQSRDLTLHNRDGYEYWVYHDPGPPPGISDTDGLTDDYKWNHTMVAVWSSHLDPRNGKMIDISPASNGNNPSYPQTPDLFRTFYQYMEGGDQSQGYDVNPVTGEPYEQQVVPLGDYARVLAEFWADGPDSETPPGHWFTILNYVNDHPQLVRRLQGSGNELPRLEWDVKSYLIMGGAMHDVAITAWGIKGYYDYVRPVSAIRYMADRGQSSDRSAPAYDPHGLPLIDGLIELVREGDPLAGSSNQHVNKIKINAWRGPDYISNPEFSMAGVGWILAENWWPYQRPSFVTPPFAGYISGHSTYSSAGAEVLTLMTGSEYFPGGLGEFYAPKNEFLVFEEGPSVDIHLQWARYRDASDHSSISRIWGGIHPPVDDIPGRNIGIDVGRDAFEKALRYFTNTITSSEQMVVPEDSYVYPNPVLSGGTLTLKTKGLADEALLRDITGKLIARFSRENLAEGKVLIPGVRPGVYLLQLQQGGAYETFRVVIR